MKVVPLTKDVPRAPSFVKAFEHGLRRKAANLELFKDTIPSLLGINNKLVTNLVLELGFVPKLLVEHFVIAFHPNGPKCGASKEMSNLIHFTISFENSSPNKVCFQLKVS